MISKFMSNIFEIDLTKVKNKDLQNEMVSFFSPKTHSSAVAKLEAITMSSSGSPTDVAEYCVSFLDEVNTILKEYLPKEKRLAQIFIKNIKPQALRNEVRHMDPDDLPEAQKILMQLAKSQVFQKLEVKSKGEEIKEIHKNDGDGDTR